MWSRICEKIALFVQVVLWTNIAIFQKQTFFSKSFLWTYKAIFPKNRDQIFKTVFPKEFFCFLFEAQECLETCVNGV